MVKCIPTTGLVAFEVLVG